LGRTKLHEGEVDLDEGLVARLVAAQFPALAELPVRAVESTGTVNAIYRIGTTLCARLPRIEKWVRSLSNELRWLPALAPCLSLRIPEPVERGRPTSEYPFPWAIYRWIDGDPYSDPLVADEREAAADLARFVLELRRIDPAGAPPGGRRPLGELHAVTRAAIESSRGEIDVVAAAAAWERALDAPAWSGTPAWIHTDLLRPNLLVRRGRLCAVLDFGMAGVGDPAFDVIPAWSVFGPSGRGAFRALLDVEEGVWRRARGYALHQAALIIPYYARTNPAFVALAKRTVEQVLADGD
jgi:aminoglycoside phosphotransferase (APT) family kinase protein